MTSSKRTENKDLLLMCPVKKKPIEQSSWFNLTIESRAPKVQVKEVHCSSIVVFSCILGGGRYFNLASQNIVSETIPFIIQTDSC